MILVSGAESATNPGQVLEWDKSRGILEHPIYWGSMLTKSHKRKFQTTEEELAIVSAKNHKQAMDNPFAYSNEPRTISLASDHSINLLVKLAYLSNSNWLRYWSYSCKKSSDDRHATAYIKRLEMEMKNKQ